VAIGALERGLIGRRRSLAFSDLFGENRAVARGRAATEYRDVRTFHVLKVSGLRDPDVANRAILVYMIFVLVVEL
jgi:hypothetical protein